MRPVWLESAAPQSQVKHSTTEPLRSHSQLSGRGPLILMMLLHLNQKLDVVDVDEDDDFKRTHH